jgi:hypothetical protein
MPFRVPLAKTIWELVENRHGSVGQVGSSPLPRAIQLLKSVVNDTAACSEAENLLSNYNTSRVIKHCSNCGKRKGRQTDDDDNVTLRCCASCQVVYYCGQDCQRQHHYAGHKIDCCDDSDLCNFPSIELLVIRNSAVLTIPASWPRRIMWLLVVVSAFCLGKLV